jgi:single-stranded DNA-binding protein
MSIYLLVNGSLSADPLRREGKAGPFATGMIRSGHGDDTTFVSVVGFGEYAERLLDLVKGDVVAVTGQAKLRTFTDRNGIERTGLSVAIQKMTILKPRDQRDVGSAATSKRTPAQLTPDGSRRIGHRPPSLGRDGTYVSSYSAPSGRGHVADLPSDDVDDLYPGPIP